MPFSELEPAIQRAVGGSAFARVDPEPLAAASIAQIHRALMTDGREVVVKVRRPGVLEQALVDLELRGRLPRGSDRGNVLLTPDGRLALLDFGLLSRLDDDTRSTIAQLLLAIAQNRGDDVSALILSLSHTTLESDEPGFVAELRRKLPRYHWRPLSGIRVGEALADLQRMSVKHAIRLPTSFALVGKTLA